MFLGAGTEATTEWREQLYQKVTLNIVFLYRIILISFLSKPIVQYMGLHDN